ncbi:MAG: hypothetical protein EPN88_16230 [Bacteroidetes bacterium]|nr:MAG: hypothetical protein EPN88_16230 [Bacteroidota bacterium]
MKKIFSLIILIILIGCSSKEEAPKQSTTVKFYKTLKEVALADVILNDELIRVANSINAESYFFYKNRDTIKKTLAITDSISIENYLALLYKFQISGMEFYKSNWYMKIDDGYFSVYISEYNAEEKFNSDNVELAKAVAKKCSEWDKKSESSKWWKLLK